MSKKIIALFVALILLLGAQTSVFADSTETRDGEETTREQVMQEHPVITRREATISMLLDAGWTVDEIDEWYTEEALLELDENAIAVSNNATYTKYYEGAEDDEPESVELSRQVFEYELNQVQCAEEDHDSTTLSTLSSNGVLELQPVYDWMDMDGETRNDRLYMGYSGYDGASIWNADDSCYLKQNMGLVWMGSDTYQVQYRFEWKKEPYYNITDCFGVALGDSLVMHSNPREEFTFKYKMPNIECVETLTTSSHTNTFVKNWCEMSSVSGGEGSQIKIKWPNYRDVHGNTLRGFLRFYTEVNEASPYLVYHYVYAQYYHGKMFCDASASIGVSTSGVGLSFSIVPKNGYSAETHPMKVRAKNIYYK